METLLTFRLGHGLPSYRGPLPDRLPAVGIPLRATDPVLVLDLQPIIDRRCEVDRYYTDRIEGPPDPPFSAEGAAWVEERLHAAGLRA